MASTLLCKSNTKKAFDQFPPELKMAMGSSGRCVSQGQRAFYQTAGVSSRKPERKTAGKLRV